MSRHNPRPAPLVFALSLAFAVGAVHAQNAGAAGMSSAPLQISIQAQPLAEALNDWARQTRIQIIVQQGLVDGKNAPAISGRLTPRQALDRLLAGSGLVAIEDGSVVVVRAAAAVSETTLPTIVVTATAESVNDLPPPYAGGQVARGGRVGLLGSQEVMNTPFNVIHYTAELMQNQQAVTIADVLANDPSVRVSSYGLTNAAGAGDLLMIRGFSARTLAFDGVYGIASSRIFPVEAAERVEVLKGPNALLNGMAPNGEVGGAINVVPKRAGDEPLTRLTATYASKGVAGTHLDIGRRFGDEQQWGVRFNGVYRNGSTAMDGQSLDLGVAAVAIDYRGSRLRASLDLGHQNLNTQAPNGAGGLGIASGIDIPAPPNAKSQIAQDWEFSKSKNNYLLAKLEYELTPAWTLYGAAGGSNNRFQYLSTDIYVVDSQGNAQATTYYWPDYWNYRSLQAGLRGSLRTGEVRHDINLNASVLKQDHGYTVDYYGFTSFDTNIYSASAVSKPSLAGFSSSPPKTDTLSLPTIAIADTLSMADGRVALTLGVRHQQVKLDNYDTSTGARSRTYDESAITPMLGLLVKPQQNVSIYGNYIQALSQGPTAPVGTTNAGEIFPPIKTKQVEAGVKVDFGRFTATTSVFQIEKPNAMTVADASTGSFTYVSSGQQRNRGIELNVLGELGRSLRTLGGVTYTDARLTRMEGGTHDGMTATGVPRWLLNLGGEWDLGALPGLTLSARMLATSSQYLDDANTSRIPGWTRWDIGARYNTKALGRPFVVRANIENLLGRNYWASASGNWLTLGGPRTVMLSASMDF